MTSAPPRRSGGVLRERGDDGEHARRRLPRPGLAEHQGVARQELPRHLALRGVEDPPLRDGEPRGPGCVALFRFPCPDAVDEPEGAGELRRDEGLDLEQALVDALQGLPVALPERTVDVSPDRPGKTAALERLLPAPPVEPGVEALQHLPVRALGLERDCVDRVCKHAIDDVSDQALVGLPERRLEFGARIRGDVGPAVGAGVVEEKPGSGVCDAIVAKGSHVRAGARRGGDDPRAEPDTLSLPVADGAQVVVERPDIAAGGGDDELDVHVEVGVDDRLQGGDELVGGVPVELAYEQDDGMAVGVCEGNVCHGFGFPGRGTWRADLRRAGAGSGERRAGAVPWFLATRTARSVAGTAPPAPGAGAWDGHRA